MKKFAVIEWNSIDPPKLKEATKGIFPSKREAVVWASKALFNHVIFDPTGEWEVKYETGCGLTRVNMYSPLYYEYPNRPIWGYFIREIEV